MSVPAVKRGPVQVVVATTVFLSFISLWRAAAVVLADLGSSAFYAGGIAEQAVGKAAPWFILGVMLSSYAVRAVYIESSVMFVRGGVYRVVKEAMGGTMAKLSVSALLFDYVLTGPISAVSAGLYIVSLASDVLERFGLRLPLTPNHGAAVFAVAVIGYFWWRNTQGLRESSSDALRIIQITTVMVVVLLVWSAFTLLRQGGHLPPPPTLEHIRFSDDALGWLRGTRWPAFTVVAVLVGLGHSFLAMSGEESLAQVYREIEHPKVLNLRRTGLVIFLFSLVFTSAVSFLAAALIPDSVRGSFSDNLISGIAMHLAGPYALRLLFQGFVVVVGFLMLAGAVNTAIVGSNAVLNRVSEDGVLPAWFRHPHRRFGTTHRILNTIATLQLATVVLSGGSIYVLGEAYAFGVVWSFALKGLAVLVLRFKAPGPREWRVPLNLRVGGIELPIGLAATTLALLSVALINLVTKQVATISGAAFTVGIYLLFVVTERVGARRRQSAPGGRTVDQFQLLPAADLSLAELATRPGAVLVPVRDYKTLAHLDWALSQTDTGRRDLVAMTVRLLHGPDPGFEKLNQSDIFTSYEQLLFTQVVAIAERRGLPVKLLTVPAGNVFDAIAQTAVRLAASQVVLGDSAKFSASDQARLLGQAWERVEDSDRLRTQLVTYKLTGENQTYLLGPHAPTLTPDDLDLIHQMWLESSAEAGVEVHHRDVVRAALEELHRHLHGSRRHQVMQRIRRQAIVAEVGRCPSPPPKSLMCPKSLPG